MTIAVCVFCGAMKTGAYTPCDACQQAPISEDDLIYSMALSDHVLSVDLLREISRSMQSGAPRPRMPPDSKQIFREHALAWMRTPVYRIILERQKGDADGSCYPASPSRSRGVRSWMASFFSASADNGELPPRGNKPQEGEATISIESAAKFIEAASSCLNDKDGPEFVAGIQAAFMPLHSAVMKAAGEDLGYGDVIHKYAILNRNNPKTGIHALLQLADAMYAAPACGVRFVVGHLMLTYMGQGAVRSDRPVVQTMPLVFMHTEKAVEILRIAQKWA